MKLVTYFDNLIIDEALESLSALKKIDASKNEPVTKSLFQRFQGTVFIDVNKAIKELSADREYRYLSRELSSDVTSPSAARRIFKELAKYYGIKSGIDRVIFFQKIAKNIYFYFFVNGKLIELYIDDDNRFKELASVTKVANIRFTEAGKNSDSSFSAILNVGATNVLAGVVKSVLFHRSITSNAYSYSFIGSKDKAETSDENSQRSRVYISIIRMLSKRLKMYLYILKQFDQHASLNRYVIATKKLREFEIVKGISFKLYSQEEKTQPEAPAEKIA